MITLKKSYMKTTNHKNKIKDKKALTLLVAIVLLIAFFIISISIGAANISLSKLFDIIINHDTSSSLGRVFYYVRLPRSIGAVLCGLGLSLSGALLQTLLGNAICSPSIIGVNAGSGLFMIIITAFFPTLGYLIPISSFLGALFATGLVYFIARKTGASKLSIVLSGIAVSTLFYALIDTVITIVPDAKVSRVDFMIGSFAGITMDDIKFVLPYILVSVIAVSLISFDINVLALGESTASSLGLNIGFVRAIVLITASVLAGSAISIAGLVGFVGLIVPHIAKMLIGHDHRYMLPLSAILGGAFALGCDILSRVLFIPFEVPVGIVMSIIGSPFFIYLILSKRRRATID